MMGGYHFRRIRISGERYSAEPEKNAYSHPCDALGYTGTRLFGTGLRMRRDGGYGDGYDGRSEGMMDTSRSAVTGY
jgi:hypothetical protein